VRLVGGPNDLEGLVEVCLKDKDDELVGTWRRWCDSVNFKDDEATTMCRQLHSDMRRGSYSSFFCHGPIFPFLSLGFALFCTDLHSIARGNNLLLITNVSCSSDTNITNCRYNTTSSESAENCIEVAVVCEGELNVEII